MLPFEREHNQAGGLGNWRRTTEGKCAPRRDRQGGRSVVQRSDDGIVNTRKVANHGAARAGQPCLFGAAGKVGKRVRDEGVRWALV